jgi:hypothetical protein
LTLNKTVEAEIKNKISERDLIVLIKFNQKSVKMFNKSGAIFLTIIFYIMIQKFKQNRPINITQSVSNQGGEDNVIKMSLLPIFTLKNKKTPK